MEKGGKVKLISDEVLTPTSGILMLAGSTGTIIEDIYKSEDLIYVRMDCQDYNVLKTYEGKSCALVYIDNLEEVV